MDSRVRKRAMSWGKGGRADWGSKQQCCWGWLFLVASSLPSIPPHVSSGREGGSEGPRERVHLFHVMPFCARQLGLAGLLGWDVAEE